jgi:DNA invertase Pin-like site-specific DNA recombinase
MQQEKRPQIPQEPNGLRAAQYVRMSTDHQKYSIENQAAAIAAYAAQRNLEIVRTYSDRGRSGVRLNGREALQDLLRHVKSGQVDFNIILVYDVSRWGRFQNTDESAYYEFLCNEAGIHVMYCAEQFENDGSLVSAVLKNIKRVMAGEYSRELSTKVFVGQSRLAKLGFWQGGPAGYGIRRQLVDENGKPKGKLEQGQRKSINTDRTILVPGPQFEIRIIKRIFKSFVVDKKSRTQIAADLNADKICNARGRRWTMLTIHNILKNEVYIGHTIFGRKSTKVGQKGVVRNPPETWIRSDNAFKRIIAPELFAEAQKRIVESQYRLSDQELLDRLLALWRKKGHLSVKIITSAKGMPSASCYNLRFGSLVTAYQMIGFETDPKYDYKKTKAKVETIIDSLVNDVVSNVERLGGSVSYFRELHLLTINARLTVAIGVATCVSDGTVGARRWQLRKFKYARADLSLVLKMNESNTKIQAYYLIPTANLPVRMNYKLRMASRVFSEEYRQESLGAFYRMWTRKGALPLQKPTGISR